MKAREIIEAMVGFTDEEQTAISDRVIAAVTRLRPGDSTTLETESPRETAYVIHVMQGLCSAEILKRENRTFVRLTRLREKPTDLGVYAQQRPART